MDYVLNWDCADDTREISYGVNISVLMFIFSLIEDFNVACFWLNCMDVTTGMVPARL